MPEETALEGVLKLPPAKDNWDKKYLQHLAAVGKRYGYILMTYPDFRRPMPLRMLAELGYHQAAFHLRHRLPE